jgi:muramoyltetrapeptide carboxypeptidase LdcA involved in peptidoglycan recycling
MDWGEYASYYIERLEGPDGLNAWHSLDEADDAIVPFLIDACHVEANPEVRAELVEIIWHHHVPATAGFLGDTLRDPEPDVWKAALDGLVALGGHQALRVLESARPDMSSACSRLREFGEWIEEAIGQVREHLTTESGLMRPQALRPGDTVATVTLSWGGPGTFPYRYQAGKQQLQDAFSLRVVEMEHTLSDPAWVARHPKARADDLMAAFTDPSINGIVSTIGGDDSIRILPYLDLDVIRANPKVFLGYSDTTNTHMACFKAGIVSFYGPSIMAGFGENCGMFPYMVDSVRRTLFSADPPGLVAPNEGGWTVEYLDWANPEHQAQRRKLQPTTGWRFLQGTGVHSGHLLGGCLEVLDWLRGTGFWPGLDLWRGAILFIETSEEAPDPRNVTRMLRSFAAMGVLNSLAGILYGRPGGGLPPERFGEYDEAIMQVVAVEEGLTELPVVTNMDFGHTDPMMVMPMGVRAEIDCDVQTFSIVESAVAE